MKKVIINQCGFLGDIIFVMRIAQYYLEKGYEIEFPIMEEIMSATDISEYFPGINFYPLSSYEFPKEINLEKFYEDENLMYLPLNCSPIWGSSMHMGLKYEKAGFDYSMWSELSINRNLEKEQELYDLLSPSENFRLICPYNTYKHLKVDMNLQLQESDIILRKIEGYSLFDWIGIMLKAKSIHTVGTSFVFLLDKYYDSLSTTDVNIYRRSDGKGHHTYDFLLKNKYNYL